MPKVGFWKIVGASLLGEKHAVDLMRKMPEEREYKDRKLAAANALVRSDGVVAQARQMRQERGQIDRVLVDAGWVFRPKSNEGD
jgi:hypothetical protein